MFKHMLLCNFTVFVICHFKDKENKMQTLALFICPCYDSCNIFVRIMLAILFGQAMEGINVE